jgi:hypothetical protein
VRLRHWSIQMLWAIHIQPAPEIPAASVFLAEIHHCLAEINRCKSIKRTELFPIPSVQSNNRNSGGTL